MGVAKALLLSGVVLTLAIFGGCDDHEFTPMDESIFDNMKDQPRYEPYEASPSFDNGTIARKPPAGTVRRSAVIGSESQASKPKLTMAMLRDGRETFNIHCSPCHGEAGYGDGMVVRHGFPAPPSLHKTRLRNAKDSYLRHVIVHGLGKMPPYDDQVPPNQRTALIAYIRTLQRSQHAKVNAVPANQRAKLDSQAEQDP